MLGTLIERIKGSSKLAAPQDTTHVLHFIPPYLIEGYGSGIWEILPLAAYETGGHQDDPGWMTGGERDLAGPHLAGFAAKVLGFPVTLTRFEAEIRPASRRIGGWRSEAAYWVVPAGDA